MLRVQNIGGALLGCCVLGQAAQAAPATALTDLSQPALPTFAMTAPPEDLSPWRGLYVGTEVFGVTGGKGTRGGFGGSGYLGYERALDNGLVVGLQGSAGYVPSLSRNAGVTGYSFGETEIRVGYDMGRFMPFVTAGVGLARPNLRGPGGYGGVATAANSLFDSNGDLRAFETVGAGFAYRLTDKLTVELAVQAYRGNGYGAP